MIETLVVADDLTGALECGCLHAGAGVDTIVALWPCGAVERQSLVVDVETRHLPPCVAAQRIFDLATAAKSRGVRRVYLKTDSTLRGPIGAQLEALMRACPGRPIVYAPAYPRMGRVVRSGCLFVNGEPLANSAFSHDVLEPARTSSVLEVLRAQCSAEIASVADAEELRSRLRNPSAAVYVCDAASEADLYDISRVVKEENAAELCAGPAGFFAQLAQTGTAQRKGDERLASTGLIVNGSMHPASLQQADIAELSGIPVFRLTADPMEIGDWSVITTGADTVAECIGDTVRSVLGRRSFESLTIFGGDTAYQILSALSVRTIHPLYELLPGIPASRIHMDGRDLVLITKAGGFGAPDTIAQIRKALLGRG